MYYYTTKNQVIQFHILLKSHIKYSNILHKYKIIQHYIHSVLNLGVEAFILDFYIGYCYIEAVILVTIFIIHNSISKYIC